MAEYTVAGGPEFQVQRRPVKPGEVDEEEQRRRAELFLRLPSLFTPGQPLEDVMSTIAKTLVEHTSAVSAGVNLVRPEDVSTVALGFHNLPAGYLEGMERARQTSGQGDIFRQRARDDETWVLKQAPAYMLSRPEYAHMYDIIRQLPYDTLIGTPFLNRPDLMGFVYLYYTEESEADEAEVGFAKELARHARPLMENAWLFRESQRRANELEALSKADEAIHQSLLLEDVYQALINLAVDLFGADRSLFLTFDEGGKLRVAAAHGNNAEELASLQSAYDAVRLSDFDDRTSQPIVVEDVAGDGRMNPRVREATNAASAVDVSVFVGGKFFGSFVLAYNRVRKFNEDERRLFSTLAARAGLAIQNAVLFREAQLRTTELEALSTADRAMHESLQLEDVYQALIDLAANLFEADRSLFLGFDPQERLHCFAARGVPEAELARLQEVYHGIPKTNFAKQGAEVSIAEDLVNDERVNPGVRKITPSKSVVDIPVFARGEFFGIFVLGYTERRTFSQDERRLFGTLASRAGLAIQNALLFGETERRAAELEALTKVDQALHESLVLEDVYQAMIDLAGNLFGADHCLFLTFDDAGVFHAAATRNVPANHLTGLQPIYAAMPRDIFQNRRAAFRIMEDVENDLGLREGIREFTNSRSTVDVNVFVGGEFHGMFVLGYHTRRTFNDNDRRLFGTLSARASLAIQNALLYRETQKRTTELEALRRADEALHTSLLLQDVERAMVDLAAELLGASSALVVTWDGANRLEVHATRGMRPEQRELVNTRYQQLTRESFAHWVKPYRTALIESVRDHPKIDTGLKDDSPISLAEIPVVVGEELWGFFSIGWQQRRTFTAADGQLFDAFASRASLAIQNALLHGETQRRANEMEALFHADEALHRSLRLEDVRNALVDLALELTNADSSLVATFGEDDRMHVVAHRGIAGELLEVVQNGYTRFDRAHFESLPQPLRMALIEDIQDAQSLDTALRNEVGGSLAEVPVVVDGRFWGVFAMGWRHRRRFSEDDRKGLDAFASRASLAIQNALLFEQAQHSASMEERSRIARELHDSVSQALYGIGLGARTARRRLGDDASPDVIEPVEYIVQLAESGLAETRALIFELVPDSLEKQGLVLALQRQAAATQARFRIQVEAFLCDEPELPIRAKEALYRIAQESLHNMAKHSQASHASLRLEHADSLVRLVVQDNGRGFDATVEFPGHLGLVSMQERTVRIGGSFLIESAPGKGTTVTAAVPC